jgi:1-aminocyclopropane-1-carboxylate deaminase/D-cysteine desulfhydrase-like pyridoxal-dependent ACC family enzyme
MDKSNFIPPLQQIIEPFLEEKGIQLFVLRTDLNHPEISGNKLYKLKYNIEEAKKQHKDTLLTFGGAFSNHIAATAAAGKEYGLKTIGIIRGEESSALNPTLQLAQKNGMQLDFVSRELYRNKNALMQYVTEKYKNTTYIIPEGGSNILGVKGCTEITNSIDISFDYICSPCGTGATVAGIILSLKEKQKAIGFQVLKADGYIRGEVGNWLKEFDSAQNNWEINEDYHFGGYAKLSNELKQFAADFYTKHNIPLDYVYTAKMMYGIFELIKKDFFKNDSIIIAVHTGGLQGNERR